MNHLELIDGLLKGNYQSVLHAAVALRPIDYAGNIFDQIPVIDYLNLHPFLLKGFKITDEFDSDNIIGLTEANHLVKLSFKNNKIQKIVIQKPNPLIKRIKLIIQYDGTNYAGFQRQSKLETIQSQLESAISQVNGKFTIVNGASRTDAGVHAFGQVVHFDTELEIPLDKWVVILNNSLPKDIRVKTAEWVSQLFHSRFDVMSKEYRYVLNLGQYSPFTRLYEWNVTNPIDFELLNQELKKLEGTHDFTSFCKGDKSSKIRTIYETKIERIDDKVYLTFIGNGFLHNMIRIIVAVLIGIASHRIKSDIDTILESKSRKVTKYLAPSSGLYLVKINF